jgi:hypothetical protein
LKMSTPTLEELKATYVKYDDGRRHNADWISRGELQRERYLRTPCPAPASRKKLKSAMPDNRELSAYSLYIRTGRKPGFRGGFAKWLRAQAEAKNHNAELREIARGKTKAEKVKADATSPTAKPTVLGRLKNLLTRRGSRGA